MSGADPRELQAILGGARAPAGLDRVELVRRLGDFAAALVAGKQPDAADVLFVAGGIHAWLQRGGNLTRDYWRTAGRQGSTHTEAVLWAATCSSRRATATKKAERLAPSSLDKEPDR